MGSNIVNYSLISKTQASRSATKSTPTSVRKFILAKLRARREKDLCYYCDEKYNQNHKCKDGYYVLVGQEESKEVLLQLEGEEQSYEAVEENKDEQQEIVPEVSFNAPVSQYHPQTITLKGKYKGF